MDLFLIRHAQSANNAAPESERVADPGLTVLGERQAQHLGDAVVSRQPTLVFTSPFRRTLETTRQIHRATKISPLVKSDLHEQGGCYSGYESVGRVGQPGMTRADIESEFNGYVVTGDIDESGWWKSRDYETLRQASERAEQVIAWVSQEFGHTDERVALVMHADFKTLILQRAQTDYVSTPYNASVTHLRVGPNGFQLVEFNDVSHLPDDLLTF